MTSFMQIEQYFDGPAGAGVKVYDQNFVMWTADGPLILAADVPGLTFAGAAVRGPQQPAFHDNDPGCVLDNTNGLDGQWTRNGFDAAGYFPKISFRRSGLIEVNVTGTTPKPGQKAHVVNATTVTADATTQNYVGGIFMQPAAGSTATDRWLMLLEPNA